METKKKKKIFLSLPFADEKTPSLVVLLTIQFTKMGYDEVIYPARIYPGHPFDVEITRLLSLSDCDAVYFTDDWDKHFETRMERDFVLNCTAFHKKLYKKFYECDLIHM